MYCATLLTVKVCSSLTSAIASNPTSCGTYKFIDIPTLAVKPECLATEIQLMQQTEIAPLLVSPFNLSIANGGLIASAVLLVWATAWAWRAAQKSLSAGDPE